MEIRETTQETFKNFLREWMFHRWRSTFVVKKKKIFLKWWICAFFYYLTCFLMNNSNFQVHQKSEYLLLLFALFWFVHKYTAALLLRSEEAVCVYVFLTINKCLWRHILCEKEDFHRRYRTSLTDFFLVVYHQKI